MRNEDALHTDKMKNFTMVGTVMNTLQQSLNAGFVEFFDVTSQGFLDFGNLAHDVLSQILRQIIQITIQQKLIGSFASATSAGSGILGLFAKGAAISSPSLSTYSNQVIDTPTPFMFAKGGTPGSNLGVFGEAGAEAIMPLTRTSGGDLGVKAVSSAPGVTINIENNTSQEIEMEQISEMMKPNDRGEEQKVISIVIKNARTNSNFRNALKSSIG